MSAAAPPARAPDFVRGTIALMRSGRVTPRLWLLGFVVLACTTLGEIRLLPAGGAGLAAAMLLRVLLVVWLGYGLLRACGGSARPLEIATPYARFLGAFLLLFAGQLLVLMLADRLIGEEAVLADRWLAQFLATLGWMVATIRLFAWQAALALGDRRLGAAGAWAGLAGVTLPLVKALMWLVAPFLAIHLALSLLLIEGGPAFRGTTGVALALIDALVSLGQLGFGSALCVAAWTVARARTGELETGASAP